MPKLLLLLIIISFSSKIYAQNYTTEQIDSLNADAYNIVNKNPQKSIDQAFEIYAHSKKMKYRKGEIKSLECISYAYYVSGEFEKVIKYSVLAEKIALEIKDYYYAAAALRLKATGYAVLGFYDDAVATLNIAFLYTEKITHSDKKHDAKALLYDSKTFVENYKTGSKEGYADSILVWAKKSLDERLQFKNIDSSKLVFPYINLGTALSEKGFYDSAQIYFDKSLELAEKNNITHGQGIAYYQLGKIYKQKREYPKAIKYFLTSLEINKELKDVYLQEFIYEGLHIAYKETNQNKEAEFYYKKWNELKDSLNVSEKNSIKVPLDEIIKEKDLDQKSQKNKLYYIILGVTLTLILSLILIWIYFKNYIKEKKINQKNTINLSEKDQKLSELEVKVNDGFDEILELAQNDSPSFLLRFKEVYPEFYNKLITTYPELTVSQLRFCALIKLNFSTKEIAHFHHMSIRGVQTKKNRLRKQLNIPSGEDLNKWMMEF